MVPEAGSESFFTAKNFAIFSMVIIFIYLSIVLLQVCKKKGNGVSDRESDLTEELLYENSSYEYYYSEEYTNSQYLRSDAENSFIDHKNFKYD